MSRLPWSPAEYAIMSKWPMPWLGVSHDHVWDENIPISPQMPKTVMVSKVRHVPVRVQYVQHCTRRDRAGLVGLAL
jgi:hypothetical protein